MTVKPGLVYHTDEDCKVWCSTRSTVPNGIRHSIGKECRRPFLLREARMVYRGVG